MSRIILQTKAASVKPLTQKRRANPRRTQTSRLPPDARVFSPHDAIQLNQALGNRAATRQLDPSANVRVQPKLTVNHFDDEYEQEANRVAKGQQPRSLQPATQAGGVPVSNSFAKQLRHARGGHTLPESTRSQMEDKLDTDLSQVRIHTDSKAGQLNQQLQSHAFTHGHDIYFNQGRYQPGTTAGDQLLAHELTHVAQQDCLTPMLQAAGRSSEEVAQKIIELCDKNGKIDLAPNLIEVVNLCLATFEDNTEIEDRIFDYLPMILATGLMPEDAAQHLILEELATHISELEEVRLPGEAEMGDSSSSGEAAQYDIVPIEERPVIKLYMEQGVAAPLGRTILFSGQFSTCSPIIMLNASTGMGGLFHFAAKGLHKQSADLLKLCDLVNPNVICLMESDFGMHLDTKTLKKFFNTNRPTVSIQEMDETFSGLYITFNKNKQLKIYEQSPKQKSVTHNLRKADTVKLPPNTHFVGKSEVDKIWL